MKNSKNPERLINQTFSFGIIYVYSIPGKRHQGRLKIGSATVSESSPTEEDIKKAAYKRIDDQTKTADIPSALKHTELAIANNGTYFSDYDVHEVLIRSGYERKAENVRNSHSEWFEVSLEVAKKAIQATKEGRKALSTKEKTVPRTSQFPFRPSQLDAIDKTTKAIKKKRKHFLWNAKMRFGKTSAAMQVAKENEMKKVLIVTHRPSVNVDWYDDFNKVFAGTEYEYSEKTKGENISALMKGDKPFVYFASLQDLRLSKRVVEDRSAGTQARGFDKNDEIFDTTWDMLIVDEAHEGTQSNLGDATFSKIPVNFTLQLSGTPFNILYKHEEEDIYTWDYVMEQEEKLHWDERNPGVPNPYAKLPALSIFTYDVDKFDSHIGSLGENFHDLLDGAFKFHEFFRVHKDDEGNDTAEFVYEPMVRKFLDLLVNNKLQTKFPYATEEYRSYNKHSLWLLPNRVKVIEAMEKLLKDHQIFGSNEFGIVNISGNNQDDDEDKDAKGRVTGAIKNHDYTITLTGQRLTTGASIPEWTAIFMMSDTNSATTYLQTAFRCQTPAEIDGKLKTQGYVFDFAPDRTLKLVAEAIELNHKSGKTNSPEQKDAMRQFLNFCPILAAKGGSMQPYDVGKMLGQLKKAVIERVSRNGFDDPKLYTDELLQLDELDINNFNQLKEIIGTSATERTKEIKVNEHGMDELQRERAEEAERKKKQNLSEEEEEILKKLKEARDQKKTAISILRAVSIRMPMLVYGANVSIQDDITLEKFIELVDEESWQEFMPAGLSKEGFGEFTKYYDEDVFKGVAHNIRAKAFDCDDLPPFERVKAITEIFKTFKNPDKETVLTPWTVVNLHLGMTLGGYDFRNEGLNNELPIWKDVGEPTKVWSDPDAKVLEINSKSGLYPLLAACNFYHNSLSDTFDNEEGLHKELWNAVLETNIYVLCKSPMAKSIALRTLAGYSGAATNIVYVEDLVKKLQQKDSFKDYNVRNEILEKFNLHDKNMKFTAIIGNPPYNEKVSSSDANRSLSRQLFPSFIQLSINLHPKCISLITPSRWFKGEGQDGSFLRLREFVKKNNHFTKIIHHPKATDIFPGIVIKGGVSYFLWQQDYVGDVEFTNVIDKQSVSMKRPMFEEGLGVILDENESVAILKKVINDDFISLTTITKGRNAFGIIGKKSELNKMTQPECFVGAVEVRCMKNEIRYAKKDGITKNVEILEAWKIFVSKSAGDPAIDSKIISAPYIAAPDCACTDTFIPIGRFKTKQEAENLAAYIKTRFLRYIISIMKVSQNVSQNVYHFVPLQNFTAKSDIDWSKSIAEIDKQLYAKYGLDKKEINFIEAHVKDMI